MAVESEDASGTSGAAAVADAQRQAAIKSSLDRCLALVRRLRTEFAAECSLLELDQLAPLLFTPIVYSPFGSLLAFHYCRFLCNITYILICYTK